MRTSMGCIAILIGAMGIVTDAMAENNSSLAPLIITTRTIGVCSPAPNGDYNGENTISPIGEAGFYLRSYEHQQIQNVGTVTVLQQPAHGVLRLVTEADRGTLFDQDRRHADVPLDPSAALYAYLPEQGYLGKDSATVLVEIGGVQIKVVYFFQAIGPGAILGNSGLEELCSKTGYHWKISSTLDANGNSTITSVEYQSPIIDASATSTDTAALASTLGSSILRSVKGARLELTLHPSSASAISCDRKPQCRANAGDEHAGGPIPSKKDFDDAG